MVFTERGWEMVLSETGEMRPQEAEALGRQAIKQILELTDHDLLMTIDI